MDSNRVELIGYVGKAAECRQTGTGVFFAKLRVATHRLVKKQEGGHEFKTTWHNVISWDKTAGYAERSFVKGSRILVQGTLQYYTCINPNGTERTVVEIKATSLLNLDR